MYYYHLCFSLYSSEFADHHNLHLFDSSLPTHLVPQCALDSFDTQYQQYQQYQQNQQQHYDDGDTDTGTTTLTPYIYPRKRLRESLPSSDLSLPNIDQLAINDSNSNDLHNSSPTTTVTTIHEDFRLGPIDIECIDKNSNDRTERSHCNLGYGILHLYRDNQPAPDDLMPDMLAVMARTTADDTNDDRGLMTCTLAVPSYMTTNDFLAFVRPFDATVTHYRFIRDAAPNKYMVMMKFDEVQSAYDYHRKFNGRRFHGMEPEICHIVFIASSPTLTTATTTTTKYPMLMDTFQAEYKNKDDPDQRRLVPLPQTLELPTCPVCLERLDKTVTGLLGIMCQHSFDCGCLGKWGDGNCPICLFSEKPVLEERRDDDMPQRNHQGWLLSRHASDARVCCYVCGEKTGSLWICMICGHIGCGRYQAAHAYDHYQDTKSHLFALEIETQRVWDYVGDGYVHRLIQNTVDGKLVEFPGVMTNEEGNGGPKPVQQITTNNNNNIDGNGSSGGGGGGLLDGWHGFEQQSTVSTTKSSTSPTSSSSSIAPISSSSSTKKTWATAAAAAGATATATTGSNTNITNVPEMDKIEAMSMEYTTLLTSQLESQRIYYEDQMDALEKQLATMTAKQSHLDTERTRQQKQQNTQAKQRTQLQHELQTLQRAATLLDDQRTILKQHHDTSKGNREQEKAMTNQLSDENEQLKNMLKDKQQEAMDMEEELRDLAFFVQTRNKIQHVPEMVGGSVGTTQRRSPTLNKARRGGKKSKR